MNEKMKAAMKGVYDNLSDELKEKAKACKTMDELMALAGKEGVELPDEVLDQVSGGGWGEDYIEFVEEVADGC